MGLFTKDTEVQVQVPGGLFADANKLKPKSNALQIIKGIIFGAVTIGLAGAAARGGIAGIKADANQDVAARDAALGALPFAALTGAAIGAIFQWERTRVHNNWVDRVADNAMGRTEAVAPEHDNYRDQMLANKTRRETAERGVT